MRTDAMVYNYGTIKIMAKSKGKRVEEFLALSIRNDPFYVGQPAELERAKWFAKIWDSGILAQQSHLRGIHYVLISQGEEPIILPSGEPYENTDNCWEYLVAAAKVARYLELVDPRAFKDRRNQPAQIFTVEKARPFISINSDCFDLELPEFPDPPSYYLDNYTGTQKYMTEIWIEKSSMEDELIPLCQRYGCNLVTGVGELSITQCILLVDRIIKYQRPCRILYISDFDPAGRSMPVAVARKVEFYQRNQYPDLDIQIQQVALTHDQCLKYKLPRTPIKETELRASKFEALYGEGATELEALEALYPGKLAGIVRKELDRFYDGDLAGRCSAAANSLRLEMEGRRDQIASQYEDEIDDLEGKYDDIKCRFEGEMADLVQRVQRVYQAIHEGMVENQPVEIHTPEAKVDQGKGWKAPLYNSDRDYEEQLDYYQHFKGGTHASGQIGQSKRRK